MLSVVFLNESFCHNIQLFHNVLRIFAQIEYYEINEVKTHWAFDSRIGNSSVEIPIPEFPSKNKRLSTEQKILNLFSNVRTGRY